MPRLVCFRRTSKAGMQAERVSRLRRSATGRRARRARGARGVARRRRPALVAELRGAAGAARPVARRAARTSRRWRRAARRSVVTGQQVGPVPRAALHDLQGGDRGRAGARRSPSRPARRCVPIFWLQTEDHDFAEIDHCAIARGGRAAAPLARLGRGGASTRARRSPKRGSAPTSRPRSTALARGDRGAAGGRRGSGAARRALRAGRALRRGVRRRARGAVRRRRPACLPSAHARRRHAGRARLPHARSRSADEIATRLAARDAALAAAGFDAQVHVRPDASLVVRGTTSRGVPASSVRARASAADACAAERRRAIRRASPRRRCCGRSCRTPCFRRPPTSAARPRSLLRPVVRRSTSSSICLRRCVVAARPLPPRRRPHPRAASTSSASRPPPSSSRARRCSPPSARAGPRRSRRPTLRAAILDAPHRRARVVARRASASAIATSARAFNRTRATLERAVDGWPRATRARSRCATRTCAGALQRARARRSIPTARRKSASSRCPRSPPTPAPARSSRESWPPSIRSIPPCRICDR